MKRSTYFLSSPLPSEATIARLGDLFARAGVQYRTEGLRILSTSTPVALLSAQRTLYSNRNWVGLNPFAFVSGVDLRCHLGKSGRTEITIQVNKLRTFLWVAFWSCCSGLTAVGLPQPEGAILFISVSLTAWFALVSFLSGYLIRKEIAGCLKENVHVY